MADRQMGYGATMTLVMFLVLVVLAVAAWQLGLFERGSAEDERAEYKVGVTDVSGGELIVRDADEPQIEDLELPKTPMTPVPPGEEPGTAATTREGAD